MRIIFCLYKQYRTWKKFLKTEIANYFRNFLDDPRFQEAISELTSKPLSESDFPFHFLEVTQAEYYQGKKSIPPYTRDPLVPC